MYDNHFFIKGKMFRNILKLLRNSGKITNTPLFSWLVRSKTFGENAVLKLEKFLVKAFESMFALG